ncbi:hypothetical protein [Bacillus sp. T33-2]|uniref:hypothetical protein n=1 Tax=Bacillus sp. T33-2 TaxID=2054168 RepID=UPI0015E0605D|nr:hypothetical protein [Bacillus sp. T33-2]
MKTEEKTVEIDQKQFFDAIKKAYDKGMNEKEITVKKIVEDLTIDLKNVITE